MKKIISLVLVFMMVLSLTTVAFAQSNFKDVDSKNEVLTEAVNLLNALNIINGYEDGTFKPTKAVTRAEMAKILVVARGYGHLPGGGSSYTDTKGHWADAYIDWASTLGIIQGYPDGTFKPNATVSYEHAMVMILRAMGYKNSMFNSNRSDDFNAVEYKKKSLELGFYKDISKTGGGADRGDVAIMLNTALNKGVVEEGTTGNAVPKMEMDKNGKQVAVLFVSYIATQAQVTVTSDMLSKGHLIDLSDYLYQTINVYKNDEGKIVYVSDVLSTVGTLEDNKKADAVVEVDGKNYTLAYDKDKVAVVFNGSEAVKNLNEISIGAKVVLSGTPDKYVIEAIVYEAVNDIDLVSKAYKTGDKRIGNISLPVVDGKVDMDSITVVGDAQSLKDIRVNDVIQVYKSADNKLVKIHVTRDTVSGKVEKRSSALQEVTINNKSYGLTKFKPNQGANTLAFADIGFDKGNYLLDMDGNIAYVEGKEVVVETNLTYGFITGFADGTKGEMGFDGIEVKTYPKLRMYGLDGNHKDYEIAVTLNSDGTIKTSAENVNITSDLKARGFNDGLTTTDVKTVVVGYTLDKDGRINKVQTQKLNSGTEKVTSANFLVDGNTKMLVKEKATKYTPVSKSELRTDTAVTFEYIGDAKGWIVVILPSSALKSNQTVQADKYGLITEVAEVLNKAGNRAYEVTIIVEGKKEVYVTADGFTFKSPSGTSTTPVVSANVIYSYSLNGDGELTEMTYKTGVELVVESSTSEYFISGGTRHTFADNAVIYKNVEGKLEVGSALDLAKDVKVVVFKNSNDYVEIVIVQ